MAGGLSLDNGAIAKNFYTGMYKSGSEVIYFALLLACMCLGTHTCEGWRACVWGHICVRVCGGQTCCVITQDPAHRPYRCSPWDQK